MLDVGCGDGAHYGRHFASIVKEYHGLDVSEAAVKAANKTGGKAGIRVLPQRGLLHGAMYLTPAEEFSGIQHAAAKLLFWPGATRHQRHRTRQREEIQNTHKSFVCLMRLPSLP